MNRVIKCYKQTDTTYRWIECVEARPSTNYDADRIMCDHLPCENNATHFTIDTYWGRSRFHLVTRCETHQFCEKDCQNIYL
jgi:hypothetical protein